MPSSPVPQPTPHTGADAWLAAATSVAIAAPVLLAYNVPPSATFLNQALAFVGWGLFFIYVLFRFRKGANPKASYTGAKGKISKGTEVAVAIVEVILLVFYAIPAWTKRVKALPSESELRNCERPGRCATTCLMRGNCPVLVVYERCGNWRRDSASCTLTASCTATSSRPMSSSTATAGSSSSILDSFRNRPTCP